METKQPNNQTGQQPTLWRQYLAAVILTARQLFFQAGTAMLLLILIIILLVTISPIYNLPSGAP